MNAILVALLLAPLAQSGTRAADAQAGKALWDGPATQCKNCHGLKGEGAFGPDLAGRPLSVPQFRQAVRKPWGIMPAFTEQQLSDQEIANLVWRTSTACLLQRNLALGGSRFRREHRKDSRSCLPQLAAANVMGRRSMGRIVDQRIA